MLSSSRQLKIGALQGSTDGTVPDINEITAVIASVNDIVGTNARSVEEQNAATRSKPAPTI